MPNVSHHGTIMSVIAAGIPDEPQACTVHNSTETYVTLACIPGYSGGDVIMYHVDTQFADNSRKSANEATEVVNQTLVYIRVKDLYPGTEYTGFVNSWEWPRNVEQRIGIRFQNRGR